MNVSGDPFRLVLGAVDELAERRVRLGLRPSDELAVLRAWLFRLMEGQEGSSSGARAAGAHSGDVLVLDFGAVAEQLHVSLSTVKRLARSGRLPTVRLGARVLVRADDLRGFVAGLVPSSGEEIVA